MLLRTNYVQVRLASQVVAALAPPSCAGRQGGAVPAQAPRKSAPLPLLVPLSEETKISNLPRGGGGKGPSTIVTPDD